MGVKIVERFTSTGRILEADKKNLPEGILCRAKYQICSMGEKNRNNRVYERAVWERVMADPDIKEKLKNRSLFFHAEHPTTTQSNTEKVAGVVSGIDMDERKVYATMEVLDTPYGRIVDTLLRAGCGIGVSTRADGELEECMDESGNKYSRVIPESYKFVTVDFTADPSSYGSEMPIEVQRGVAGVVKTSIDNESMDREYATVLLEHMNITEAKTILESMKIDKHHKGCKCKASEKKCTTCPHVKESHDIQCPNCGKTVGNSNDDIFDKDSKTVSCSNCGKTFKNPMREATARRKKRELREDFSDPVWDKMIADPNAKEFVRVHSQILNGGFAQLYDNEHVDSMAEMNYLVKNAMRFVAKYAPSFSSAYTAIMKDYLSQESPSYRDQHGEHQSNEETLDAWDVTDGNYYAMYEKMEDEIERNYGVVESKVTERADLEAYQCKCGYSTRADSKYAPVKCKKCGMDMFVVGEEELEEATDFKQRLKDDDKKRGQYKFCGTGKKFESKVNEVIKKVGGKWQVQSHKGKNLGTYATEAEAKKRLGQVEYFKHKANEDMDASSVSDEEAKKKLAGAMDQASVMAQNAQGTTRVTETDNFKKWQAEAQKYYSYMKIVPDKEDLYDYYAQAMADEAGISYDQAMEEVEAKLGKLEEKRCMACKVDLVDDNRGSLPGLCTDCTKDSDRDEKTGEKIIDKPKYVDEGKLAKLLEGKSPKELVQVVKDYYKDIMTPHGDIEEPMSRREAIKHIAQVTNRSEDEVRDMLKEDVSIILPSEGQITQYLTDNWDQFLNEQDAVDNLIRIFKLTDAKAKSYVDKVSQGKGKISATYAMESVLQEKRRVMENYGRDAVRFGKEIGELKEDVSKLTTEKVIVEQMLKQKSDEIAVLTEKVTEVENEKQNLTEITKEATLKLEKELVSLKEQHKKDLLKTYLETKIKCMGLRLSEQCLTILGLCKTPVEVDATIRQYQNAFTESALHFSGIKGIEVTETVQADPKQAEIDNKVGKAMSAWLGKPQTK